MCIPCVGRSIVLNNGELSAPAQRTVECDLTKEMIQELRLAIETRFLKTKDKGLIEFIKEVNQYYEQFYTIDICAQLGRINVLRQEYL
jgi:hypothetical protein